MASMNMSNAFLYAYINGSLKGGEIPQQFFHDWVDVRNVAQAHVLAYVSHLFMLFSILTCLKMENLVGEARSGKPALRHFSW